MGVTVNTSKQQVTATVTDEKVSVSVAGGIGPSGTSGTSATIAVGTVTTGAPGSSASVVNSGTSSAAVFDFSIPAGATGSTGPSGAAGATGPAGDAATITVGTVTTGAAGSSASVTNAGTSNAAVLNFTIPAGATGATGATGSAGAKGDKGDAGDSGVAYATAPVTYDSGTKTVALSIGSGLTTSGGSLVLGSHTHTFGDSSTTSTYTNFLTTVGGGTLADALSGIDSALTGKAAAADFDQGLKTTDSPEFAGLAFNAYAVDWAVAPRPSLGASLDFKATVSGVTSTVFSVDSSGVITFADNTTQSTAAVPYTLPMASALTLGGVTIGSGIDVVLGQISVSTASIGAAAASHTHGNITSSGAIGTTSGLPIITTASGVLTTGAFGTSSGQFAAGDHTHSQLHDRSHAITSTSDHTAGNWKVIYTNGSGQVVELALGAANTVLQSNGASAAPTFGTVQKTITSGTAAPTGGSDGDIYLQYS